MVVRQVRKEESRSNYLGGGDAANDASYGKRGKARELKLASAVGKTDPNQLKRNQPLYETNQNKALTGGEKFPGWQDKQSSNTFGKESSDKTFSKSYAKKGIQSQPLYQKTSNSKNQSYSKTQKKAAVRATQAQYYDPIMLKNGSVGQKIKKVNLRKNKKNKKKAAKISLYLLDWVVYLWFTFQLSIAVFHLTFFSLAYVVADYTKIKAGDSWYTKAFKFAVDIISDIIDPSLIFMLLQYLLMGYALILILIIYIRFKLAGLNPIFGKGGGVKTTALLFSMIGYILPLFSLFPWVIIWIYAINKYPK